MIPRRVRTSLALMATLVAAAALACGGESASAPPSGVSTRTPASTPIQPSGPRTTPTASVATQSWAAAVCNATADFDEAVLAVQDDVDPTTLTVADRRDRGVARYEAYLAALETGSAALDGVTAPPGASAYHAAVRAQFSELHRIVTEQLDRLRAAQTHDEIEAANTLLRLEVERLDNSVRLAASTLSPDAIAALQAAPRCGQIIG